MDHKAILNERKWKSSLTGFLEGFFAKPYDNDNIYSPHTHTDGQKLICQDNFPQTCGGLAWMKVLLWSD